MCVSLHELWHCFHTRILTIHFKVEYREKAIFLSQKDKMSKYNWFIYEDILIFPEASKFSFQFYMQFTIINKSVITVQALSLSLVYTVNMWQWHLQYIAGISKSCPNDMSTNIIALCYSLSMNNHFICSRKGYKEDWHSRGEILSTPNLVKLCVNWYMYMLM